MVKEVIGGSGEDRPAKTYEPVPGGMVVQTADVIIRRVREVPPKETGIVDRTR